MTCRRDATATRDLSELCQPGNIGGTLAAGFAAGGQDFLLASRDQETARKMAADLGGHAEAVSVDEAVESADVLVLAVWLDVFEELIATYGERLAGKVIIDPTNSVGPDGSGGYRKVIPEQESSGQILAGLLPAGPGWSRHSARCRPRRWPRSPAPSPSARCCSTPPRATWAPS
jgi:NADP oxidoreductase coenzyme F420-dependent